MKSEHRKKVLCFATACFFVFLFAQSGLAAKAAKAMVPSDGTGQPAIHVGETTFEFGEVLEGTDIEHNYTVKNTGTGVLNIERVRVG